MVRAMPVVGVDPVVQSVGALRRVLVAEAVGPLPKSRLNEPFGLAVGLWAVGTGELVPDSESMAGGGEGPGAEAGTIVGEQPTHRHPEAFEISRGVAQEPLGAGAALIRYMSVKPMRAWSSTATNRYSRPRPPSRVGRR